MTFTIQISPRERQVLDCRSQGLAYKQIASKLRISMGTVKTHLQRSFQKLEANSSIEAIRNLQYREHYRTNPRSKSRLPALA
jgi:DNA-binding NarL/FixJ family response regulator